MSVRGRYFLAVVPIEFRDAAGQFNRAQYQDLFFNPLPTGRAFSVRSYYATASRGNVDIDGQVFDWTPLEGTAAYYQDGCNGIGVYAPCPVRTVSRMEEMLIAALDSISRRAGGDVAWNSFDNDGPDGLPNSGDDDGVVDLVTFLQPRIDGACSGPGIWAHRFTIQGWRGSAYVTRTPRRDANGVPLPGQFLLVNSYTMQSALGGDAACTPDAIMPIGTVAHETGHAFGLPDLYDTNRGAGTEGIGEWGLMSSGNYARPSSPASFEAWSLVQLGWVAVDTLGSGRTVNARAVQVSDTVYHVATDLPGVSLLLENRQAIGPDTAMMNASFARAKGPGLLVWRIDAQRIASTLSSNTINVGNNPGVALIQADGLEQLRSTITGYRNRGDGGDPWPGTSGQASFGLMSTPTARNWDLVSLGVRLDRIAALPDGSVRVRLVRGATVVVTSQMPQGRVTVDGVTTQRWNEIVANGDTLAITADSLQVSVGGRTAARFTGWSDGGPRSRTVRIGASPPAELQAGFDVLHQLRLRVTGDGDVTTNHAQALAEGTFLANGTPARVVAVPAAGAEFVSWRGDTVSTRLVLDLTMHRPWSVTAEFVRPVPVDAVVATRALLGGAALSGPATAYLDTTGNRNGVYDVGDLLAWLRRTSRTVPPALMRLRAGAAVP